MPTNGFPSPPFGAQPFTQTLLLFEEFGREPLNAGTLAPTGTFPGHTLGPAPEQDSVSVAASAPAGMMIESFLAQPGSAPLPTRLSNTGEMNPWKADIEAFLGRPLLHPPAEGRPEGEGWAHQRWNEFKPQVFFKTAQAGARVNGGFRDQLQMHHYSVGKFGPGGLYHTVFESTVKVFPKFVATTKGGQSSFTR